MVTAGLGMLPCVHDPLATPALTVNLQLNNALCSNMC